MNIPEQGQLVCVDCGRKHGYKVPLPTVWHYATCILCHSKNSVTKQVHPKDQ